MTCVVSGFSRTCGLRHVLRPEVYAGSGGCGLGGGRVLAAVAREPDGHRSSGFAKRPTRLTVDGIAEHRGIADAEDDIMLRVGRHPLSRLQKARDDRPAVDDGFDPAFVTRMHLDA